MCNWLILTVCCYRLLHKASNSKLIKIRHVLSINNVTYSFSITVFLERSVMVFQQIYIKDYESFFFTEINHKLIQRQTCLLTVLTWRIKNVEQQAIKGISSEKLFQELSLEPLKLRHLLRKLCLFYKIKFLSYLL